MKNRAPLLNKPSPGWQRDLATPTDDYFPDSQSKPYPTLNSLNRIYMEVSRRSTKMRGLMLGIAVAPLAFVLLIPGDFTDLQHRWGIGIGAALGFIAPYILMVLMAVLCIRIDTSIPRDEPIRFNRLRRRVYVYSFQHVWWNPFSHWYVTTKSYNWSDLRAEAWRQRGANGQGGLLITWGVSIAVVKPGTNEVMERFPLSVGQDEGSSWDYVCAYMQHGPEALPPVERFNDPNEVPPYNLALRLAPKVRWPEQMDAESRSGPEDSPAVVQAQHKGQTDK